MFSISFIFSFLPKTWLSFFLHRPPAPPTFSIVAPTTPPLHLIVQRYSGGQELSSFLAPSPRFIPNVCPLNFFPVPVSIRVRKIKFKLWGHGADSPSLAYAFVLYLCWRPSTPLLHSLPNWRGRLHHEMSSSLQQNFSPVIWSFATPPFLT